MIDLYTVEKINKYGEYEMNEFQAFRDRMISNGGRDARQLQEIDALVKEITDKAGSTENMFRSEGLFRAIPSHPLKYRFWDSDGKNHFGLRLYCLVVNKEVLILLNGCSKTHQNPRKCPNCSKIYHFAEKFSEAFFDALYITKTISVDGREFDYEDEDLILNVNYEES